MISMSNSLTGNIQILNTKEERDKSGLLGKKILLANSITEVFRVRSGALHCNSNLNITNDSNEQASLRIWVSLNKSPGLIDLVESNIDIASKSTFIRTNFIMCPDEAVFILSNKDNVIVRIDGYVNGKM